MSDIVICPRIIWKVDLSNLNFTSQSCCQSVQILKSHWKLKFEIDEEWEEYKIYIMPENPEVYLNERFFVQCGLRDVFGICRFENFQTLSTDNLLTCCIFQASVGLLLNERLFQNHTLWVICTIEPESNREESQILVDKGTTASSSTSLSCKDDLIKDFNYLLKEALNHDVILQCENEMIKAHKSVLSCRSKMFEAMFRSDTKEAREGKVVIHDTPLHIFRKVVHYMYTSEINFEDIECACKIYVEADKYLIVPLKERCKAFFMNYLCSQCSKDELGSRVSYACRFLCLADAHADIPLQCWTENYLADSILLVTSEWDTFTENNPEMAIKVYFKLLKNVRLCKSSFNI